MSVYDAVDGAHSAASKCNNESVELSQKPTVVDDSGATVPSRSSPSYNLVSLFMSYLPTLDLVAAFSIENLLNQD